MSESTAKIAYITAGAAGMYCGSCMRDNTLVAALKRKNSDIVLIPTYTPILTDEENVSDHQIFLNGIKLYLQQYVPLFRHLPARVDGWLDRPWLVQRLARNARPPSPSVLGTLTVSLLKGSAGYQHREVDRLCRWLAHELRPDLVNLTNILIAGFVPDLKRMLDVPVLVTLQGDDIFLESLAEPYRTQALRLIGRLIPYIDAFLVNSRFYAEKMARYLGIPSHKIHQVPLGIDTRAFQDWGTDARGIPRNTRAPCVGYLARVAPEKGLHVLVDAYIQLRRQHRDQRVRLHIAGWTGRQHVAYLKAQLDKLATAGLSGDVDIWGTVNRQQKLAFLRGLDLMSVPTIYEDPKGLYILEANAAGVPVVQPDHGAFPELIASLGGGKLFRPADPIGLAETLHQLLVDHEQRLHLARQGRQAVFERYNSERMAEETHSVYRTYLTSRPPSSPWE